jgi:formamidopyrimidine-DNA glycosylase
MDQTKIAGLGNIYSAEALFRAGISPLVPISSLTNARLDRLHAGILETLRAAVHSIYKAYRNPGGYRQHQDDFDRFVYGRKQEPCVRCGRPIRKIEQGGRSTYFCARCQR